MWAKGEVAHSLLRGAVPPSPSGLLLAFLPSVVPLDPLFNTEINTHKQTVVRMPTLVTLSVLRNHLASA